MKYKSPKKSVHEGCTKPLTYTEHDPTLPITSPLRMLRQHAMRHMRCSAAVAVKCELVVVEDEPLFELAASAPQSRTRPPQNPVEQAA